MTSTLRLIKPKSGDEAINLYLNEVRTLLALPNKQWKICEAGMLNEISEFREEYTKCRYDELVAFFGTPRDAVERYLLENNTLLADRKKLRRQRLYKLIACASAVLLTLSIFYAVWLYRDQATFVTERITVYKYV